MSDSSHGEAIGEDVMLAINEVADKLWSMTKDKFEPYEGVYRICDADFYVTEDDFDAVWNECPSWWRMAWMLSDNGQYSEFDVAAMTVEDIIARYSDPDFEPEFAFYTEASETGSV